MRRIVRESIREHGYTIVVETEAVRAELAKLQDEVETETKYVKMAQEKKLKKYNGKYYKIKEDGPVLRVKDYKSLTKEKTRPIPLFQDFELYYKAIRQVQLIDEFTIEINGNTHELETKESEKRTVETRRPNDLLLQSWDERINTLRQEIAHELSKLEDYVAQDLKPLKENLFVEPIKATVILDKIEDIKISLHQLDIQVGELHDNYHGIE